MQKPHLVPFSKNRARNTFFFFTVKSTFYGVTVLLVLYLLPNILFKLITPEIKDVIVFEFVLLDGHHCCCVLIPKVALNLVQNVVICFWTQYQNCWSYKRSAHLLFSFYSEKVQSGNVSVKNWSFNYLMFFYTWPRCAYFDFFHTNVNK